MNSHVGADGLDFSDRTVSPPLTTVPMFTVVTGTFLASFKDQTTTFVSFPYTSP